MQELTANLNIEQRAAVTHRGSPLLIIAGAGTGKTTVITRRIAHLIGNDAVRPEEIVALTFTEKAAHEMEDRLTTLLGTSCTDSFIGTFHAFCQKILEQHGLAIGLPTPFKLFTPAESYRLVKQHFDRFTLQYYRPRATPTRFIYALVQHFSRCKDELITPEKYLAYADELQGDTDIAEFVKKRIMAGEETDERMLEIARTREIADAYHVYTQLMLENGALDFGDLMLYTYQLFLERPDILHALQKQYTHLLVDEFQDTNTAQYQLLKKLASDDAITVVGDDDQSIYKWRGASVANILQFFHDFPNTTKVVLITNYRSAQTILDAAYHLILHNNPHRLEVEQHIDKHLKAALPGEGRVMHLEAENGEEEARIVAERIATLHEEGAAWGDVAILARANSHLNLFVQALQFRGIPYQYQAATGLFRTSTVLDMIAMLRVLGSFKDHNAMHRVLQIPAFRLAHEDQTAVWMTQKKEACSLYEALEIAGTRGAFLTQEGHSRVRACLESIRFHAKLSQEKSVGAVLLSCLEKSHYLADLTHRMKEGDRTAVDALLYIKSFFDVVERFTTDHPEPSTDAFISYMQDLLDAGEEGSMEDQSFQPHDAVQLLTVHSAKGLEYDHVFIVNLVERRFPSDLRGETIPIPEKLILKNIPTGDHHTEEERRLLYVAMTRAKKTLTVTSALSYGGTQKRKPSRFLAELPEAMPKEHARVPMTLSFPKAEQPTAVAPALLKPKAAYSYSQLKTYKDCPLQYKFAHLLHIPTLGKPSLTFGNTMHRTLQKFYERIQELQSAVQTDLFSLDAAPSPESTGVRAPSLQELLSIYTGCWNGSWFESSTQKQEYFEEGKKMLQSFYERHATEGFTVPAFLEKGFAVRIGTYTLRGKIDRIDAAPGGGVVVIDYKTGKPKEKLSGEDKEQLFLYHIATEEIPAFRALGRVVALTFYYLENGSTQSFVSTPEQLADYKNTVCAVIEKIEAGEFTPTPGPFVCGSCPYRDICEFRQ